MAADVAIVGAGPAGVTLAHLLGRRGLSVELFEKDAGIHPLPRAIHFDGEVMRVFESAGLRAEVGAISRPGLKGMHFDNADGQTLLIRAGSPPRGPQGCANNHYFHQPDLEAVLRRALDRHPTVRLHTAHEVLAIDDGPEAAVLQVHDRAHDRRLERHARLVVGCDGARSLVRRLIGSCTLDLGLHQPWLVFDVRLKSPVPTLPEHTVQHCDPARPMTLCNVSGDRRRFEVMLMPGDDPEQLVQPATLWRLVARWLRPDQAQIERAVIYTFHATLAEGWRRGRLLLAGDAAHQTPPFLGQGLCAAIRDVAGLAWKLDLVLRGRADARLLDSHESERAPHVRAFIELAVRLGAIVQTTDPEAARQRDARFRAGPEVFHYPTPRLGPGVWTGSGPPVAQVFPQPLLGDGRSLDAALGDHFAWIGDAALLAAADADTRAHWQALALRVLATDGPGLQDWLQQHGVRAVLLRPDRYVAGVARDADDLAEVTRCLPAAARRPPAHRQPAPAPPTTGG